MTLNSNPPVAGLLYCSNAFVSNSNPLPVTLSGTSSGGSGGLSDSGVSPVTGSFTSATNSSAFTPIAGRNFNISVWGTFSGTVQLKRSFDGSTWLPITAAGTTLFQMSSTASEQYNESETSVQYRLECTSFTSGTINYRVSQ